MIEKEKQRAIMKRSNDAAGLGCGFCSSPGHEKLKLRNWQRVYYQRGNR